MHPDIKRSYAGIHYDNPLRKLSDDAKVALFFQLVAYGECKTHKHRIGEPSTYQASVDEAHGIARDAEALADRLDLLLQEEWNWRQLRFIAPYRILPWLLRQLSWNLWFFARMLAKPTQLDSVLAKRMLLTASEFVWLNTGSYNDEHLADLIQQMYAFVGPDDLAGDTIRKCRVRFKSDYPLQYRELCDAAKRMTVRFYALGSGKKD